MANKTRAQIRTAIYSFLPQINQTDKLTLVNDEIDFAFEEISHLHDFRALRGTSMATATMTASQFSFDETAFGPRVYTSTSMLQGVDWIKDVISMWLFDSASNMTKFVKFLDDKEFGSRYQVESVTNRAAGVPDHYTKLGNIYHFSCPLDKAYKVLARYQMYHPGFSLWGTTTATTTAGTSTVFDPDTATHWFYPRDNQLLMKAVVYTALRELKASLNQVEFPQELQAVDQLAEKWQVRLIERDRDAGNLNEDWSPGWAERPDADTDAYTEDPYAWNT